MEIKLTKETKISASTQKEDIWYWVRVKGINECFREETEAYKYFNELTAFHQKHGQFEPLIEILETKTIEPKN